MNLLLPPSSFARSIPTLETPSMESAASDRALQKFSLAMLAGFVFLHPLAAPANTYVAWPGDGYVMNTYMGSGITVGVDHTTLETLTYRGQDWRHIYDARVGFINNHTWLFNAVWEDGHATEFQLHSEFSFEEAKGHAEVFADIIGRLPKFGRHDVDYVVEKERPDVIFHVAGQVAMTTSLDRPRFDFDQYLILNKFFL